MGSVEEDRRQLPTADAEEDSMSVDEAQAFGSEPAVWEREEDMEEENNDADPAYEDDGLYEGYWEEEPPSPPLSNGIQDGAYDRSHISEAEGDEAREVRHSLQHEDDLDGHESTAERPSPPGEKLSRKDKQFDASSEVNPSETYREKGSPILSRCTPDIAECPL